MMLIKYATRGRPLWFKRSIANIMSTISNQDYLILVSCDQDDRSMMNPEMEAFTSAHEKIKVIFGTSKSKIDAINRDMDEVADWDILVNMSDDMQFTSFGWDNVIRQRTQDKWGKSLDWFAHFDDGYAGAALPTMSIMGRTYYERDKYIYHPSYRSFSSDAEAMYVAMMRGCHHYFPDKIFIHQHPSNSPMPNDETYRINSLQTPHDTKNYFERLNRYFDEPYGPETPIPFKQYLGRTA